ncbi:DUF2490 domain-containing protein [Fluoribacter dumoffii]|uniref:Uncharacterized protein n=1 Tax=Fluoribacter dumoffii TaxID=463 RepID=A0A377GDQ5_9GAMM|nr:DUF2490 domain-containing protein [Fluoribacter dumoffii]KTC91240.1 hypothetical protein Ldum_2308 [Fluoribacter dumoffii NY 23]STO22937.1 Uncharacterised protein [Fluoribacter dumoffii]
MQRNSILFCFLIGVLIFSWSTKGDCALERDFQTWFSITAIGKTHSDKKFISRLRYWLEDQERLGDDSSRFSQILLRPGN